jgi:hypothetical protein
VSDGGFGDAFEDLVAPEDPGGYADRLGGDPGATSGREDAALHAGEQYAEEFANGTGAGAPAGVGSEILIEGGQAAGLIPSDPFGGDDPLQGGSSWPDPYAQIEPEPSTEGWSAGAAQVDTSDGQVPYSAGAAASGYGANELTGTDDQGVAQDPQPLGVGDVPYTAGAAGSGYGADSMGALGEDGSGSDAGDWQGGDSSPGVAVGSLDGSDDGDLSGGGSDAGDWSGDGSTPGAAEGYADDAGF